MTLKDLAMWADKKPITKENEMKYHYGENEAKKSGCGLPRFANLLRGAIFFSENPEIRAKICLKCLPALERADQKQGETE